MAYTWRRLSRDPLALVGMATIAAISIAALSAPLIAPFDPREQFFDGLTLEGAPLPPGEGQAVEELFPRKIGRAHV
jgi:peptide/nickel transport system permease protein